MNVFLSKIENPGFPDAARSNTMSEIRCRPFLDLSDLSVDEFSPLLWFNWGFRKQGALNTGVRCQTNALLGYFNTLVKIMDEVVHGMKLPPVSNGNEFVLRAMINFRRQELAIPALELPKDPRPLPKLNAFNHPPASRYNF
jgi:hypothetical protein